MNFTIPDCRRYRISDCGQYIIEKRRDKKGDPVYVLWSYTEEETGFDSLDDAKHAAMMKQLKNLDQSSEAKRG